MPGGLTHLDPRGQEVTHWSISQVERQTSLRPSGGGCGRIPAALANAEMDID